MSYHLDTKCSMVLVPTLRSYLYSYDCVQYHARWSSIESYHQVENMCIFWGNRAVYFLTLIKWEENSKHENAVSL